MPSSACTEVTDEGVRLQPTADSALTLRVEPGYLLFAFEGADRR